MFKSGYILRTLKPGSGIGKVFRYAIGEIILVVTGILIAVSLNNWNISNKERKAVENSIDIIIEELKSDTIELNSILTTYEQREKRYNYILFDSLLIDTTDCPGCGLITSFRIFRNSTRGYNRLLNYNDLDYVKSDTIISQLLEFYTVIEKMSPIIQNRIEDDVFDILKLWRDNYEWFYSIQLNEKTGKYLDYIESSEEYKNRVAYQYILIYQNYIPFLKRVKSNTEDFIKLLEERKQ